MLVVSKTQKYSFFKGTLKLFCTQLCREKTANPLGIFSYSLFLCKWSWKGAPIQLYITFTRQHIKGRCFIQRKKRVTPRLFRERNKAKGENMICDRVVRRWISLLNRTFLNQPWLALLFCFHTGIKHKLVILCKDTGKKRQHGTSQIVWISKHWHVIQLMMTTPFLISLPKTWHTKLFYVPFFFVWVGRRNMR